MMTELIIALLALMPENKIVQGGLCKSSRRLNTWTPFLTAQSLNNLSSFAVPLQFTKMLKVFRMKSEISGYL